MRRVFEPFDSDVIKAELAALPAGEASKLVALIEHFQNCGSGNPAPAQIDDYGDGLYRLRHIKSAFQGRAIFFAVDRSKGFERLILVLIYKKEGAKVPSAVLGTAKRRMREWQQKNSKDQHG